MTTSWGSLALDPTMKVDERLEIYHMKCACVNCDNSDGEFKQCKVDTRVLNHTKDVSRL